MTALRTTLLLPLLLVATGAQAELKNAGAGGFTTTYSVDVSADARLAWQQLERVGEWWNAAHSWSGDATNLYLDTDPGGCFCERLPDGGWVEHLRITYIAPGRQIRFDGALGPLGQMGLDGTMTWSVEPLETGGSRITFTYVVRGFAPDGLEGLAPVVDGVIGEQHGRLAARLGSG